MKLVIHKSVLVEQYKERKMGTSIAVLGDHSHTRSYVPSDPLQLKDCQEYIGWLQNCTAKSII